MPAPAPPTSAPQSTTAPRRAASDRLVLGVCAGLASAIGTSPLTLRLLTLAAASLLLPLVLLAYTVAALILPADDGTAILGDGERSQRDIGWAVGLSIAATTLSVGAIGGDPLTSGWMAFALVPLAAIAGFTLWLHSRGNRPAPAGPATWQPPQYGAATPHTFKTTGTANAAAQPAEPTGTAAAATVEPPTVIGAGDPPTLIKDAAPTQLQDGPPQPPSNEPPFGDGPGGPGGPGEPPSAPQPPAAPEPPRHRVRRRSLALPVIAGMALIPALATVLAAAGAIEPGAETVAIVLGLMALVATLGAVAVALLRPSYLGAVGLLLVAAITGTLSIATSQFGDLPADGLGERAYTPTRVADLQQPFVLGAGELTLDLRELRLAPGQRVTARTELGFGQINVIVPRGARVTTDPASDAQSISVRARDNGASSREIASAPSIAIDAQLRGGEVVVLAGGARDTANLEVLARQSVGFWSAGEQRR